MLDLMVQKFKVVRDDKLCIRCGVCARQCANEVHVYDPDFDEMVAHDKTCVNCQRCVVMCPTDALTIIRNPQANPDSIIWNNEVMSSINKQSETGGVLLTSMGNPRPYPVPFDNILLNASQVTNPSIDPLREPMETRVILGSKPVQIKVNETEHKIENKLGPLRKIDIPIMFSAVSFGAVSLNAQKTLARAAQELGTFWNTGEGGLHHDLLPYKDNTIVQVASGRFGVDVDYLNAGSIVEIKIGQGAKPGIGGHLPGEKINDEVSITRMIPKGTDAISPAPHHDIYSIEDLRQLIYSIKEATNYTKPISVKIAAVHNSAAIASGIVRAGADIIAIDGFRGGTGAAPMRIRDNVGIPIEYAIASVDERLHQEGLRSSVSLIASGSIRNSADVVKAIALGADAVYVASAPMISMGCHMCQSCSTGKCNWGIATQRPELTKRLNPDIMSERLVNLMKAWNHEIQEMLGGMGINSIDSLRGNRLMLRGLGLSDRELGILGIKAAGE
ncbi:MAG: glutamate synthase-related protein [Coriobacteriales bacterium]|jgi:glutamate synthase domain-containing protein 2